MCSHRADALDLVGGNGNAQARSADQQSAVGLAIRDELRRFGSSDRVCGLVAGFFGPDVDDLGDAGVGFEVALDSVLVGYASFLWLLS